MTDDDLQAELLTVAELFDDVDARYTIPVYQRNYAWGREQIAQLIGDVQHAMEDGDETYFLGNLIVTEHDSSSTDYEVIDGQQRLTTLYLLLTFLQSEGTMSRGSHRDRLRYRSRPRATESLRRLATAPPKHAGSDADALRDEDQGIIQGFNIISQHMDQEITGRAREAFDDYLRGSVTVVRATLPAKTDLNRYFEIMNTRGQQLEQVDIVKARLMSCLGDAAEQACFAWVWESCSDMDSYVQMSLTRGRTDVRTDLFGGDWAWLRASSFHDLVRAHQSHDADDGHTARERSTDAAMTLDEALRRYSTMGTQSSSDDPENVRYRSTISFPTFLLHVLKVWRGDDSDDEAGLDDKRLIDRFSRMFDRDAGDTTTLSADVRDFCLVLLRSRNVFDAFVLKRQFTAANLDDGDWSLQRMIKGSASGRKTPPPRYINTAAFPAVQVEDDGVVDAATNDLLLIESMLRVTYTSPRTMHWITLVLRTVDPTDPAAGAARLRDRLRAFAREQVRAQLTPTGEPAHGFDIERIVFNYLDYLLVARNGDKDFRFTYRNSIEHFYPQYPDAEQSGATVAEDSLNLLGNLALVSVGANSKFSNALPSAKAWNFRQTIELQSPKLQLMAEIARDAKGWGDAQVRTHHHDMVELLGRDLG